MDQIEIVLGDAPCAVVLGEQTQGPANKSLELTRLAAGFARKVWQMESRESESGHPRAGGQLSSSVSLPWSVFHMQPFRFVLGLQAE
jgi:hypothetical protein